MSDAEARAIKAYRDHFTTDPVWIASAPGRVNLIGDHTDYSDGFAMPVALPHRVAVALGPRDAPGIEAIAVDRAKERLHFDPAERSVPKGGWQAHVRGNAAVFTDLGVFAKTGRSGLHLAIAGDVPDGAGLSSSAAFHVALAMAFDAAHDAKLSKLDLALAAQRAEVDYVGTSCGLLDQLSSLHGTEGAAMTVDFRSLDVSLVPWPTDWSILIIDSGTRRELAESGYNTRRDAVSDAANALGGSTLRDAKLNMLDSCTTLAPDTRKRARHVITENERVLAAQDALARRDIRSFGDLMRRSHASMRDDFENSVPEIDRFVKIANAALGGNGGARMTGGGFGGAVVAVGKSEPIERLIEGLNDGDCPPTYLITPSRGAAVRRLDSLG
ncbi:MAG: galactokinase [Pacificimonas sp.]